MDQGSNKNHSPAYNFTPAVTKFCVMWEGLSLPHDTKFGNCRCKLVDSRSFHSWSLIHGLRWSGLIKVGPGEYTWCNSCNCTSNFRHVTIFMVIIIILTAMGHVSDNMLKRIVAVRSCYFCTFQNISVCGSPSTNSHGSDRKTQRESLIVSVSPVYVWQYLKIDSEFNSINFKAWYLAQCWTFWSSI